MKNEACKRISVINAILLTAVSLLSVAAIALPAANAASPLLPSDQCDAEAGSEHDMQRNMAFPPVATVDIRIGRALSACREAYNQDGTPRVTFQLARVLHKAGQTIPAMAMLKKAAEADHAIAMVNYAVMIGERGDHATEFALYQKAAATGNILAAYNLGVAYRDGVGTTANGTLAAQWFERASLAKDGVAAFNLAVMLDDGVQIAQDDRKAAAFYALAAERGNVDAMINLGLMLENGEGMAADAAAARDMFKKAAEKGDVFAKAKLAEPEIDTSKTASVLPGQEARLVLPKMNRGK